LDFEGPLRLCFTGSAILMMLLAWVEAGVSTAGWGRWGQEDTVC